MSTPKRVSLRCRTLLSDFECNSVISLINHIDLLMLAESLEIIKKRVGYFIQVVMRAIEDISLKSNIDTLCL